MHLFIRLRHHTVEPPSGDAEGRIYPRPDFPAIKMRFARLPTLLLMLAAAPAWAGWVKATEDSGAVHYIDPATLSKDGKLRTADTLQDLKRRGPQGEMSRRAQWQYDCAEKRGRLLSCSLPSGPMAS